jgi:hypothetical protein
MLKPLDQKELIRYPDPNTEAKRLVNELVDKARMERFRIVVGNLSAYPANEEDRTSYKVYDRNGKLVTTLPFYTAEEAVNKMVHDQIPKALWEKEAADLAAQQQVSKLLPPAPET